MNLSQELGRYLSVRRSLGYDLSSGETILRRFVAFVDGQGELHLTLALFLRWQKSFGSAGRTTWAARFRTVRLFAQWLHGLNPSHELFPAGMIPNRYRRARPYIYSCEEITAIVATAAELPSVYGVRGLTCSTLFGLIAATGLRVSEALNLDCDDVDFDQGVLTIRRGKLGSARVIPLHATVIERLRNFIAERDRLLGHASQALFVNCRGDRFGISGAHYNFAHVCQKIGLRPVQLYGRHGHGPRIHDLRHSFAAKTLIDWYRADKDPGREMIKLTSYLGHKRPECTYWYIEAVPELLELASQRLALSKNEGVDQ